MRQNRRRELSCISTSWSTVYQAHQGQGHEVVAAQRRLLLRYYNPIYRYLCAMVRDADEAEELTHEFVVRFLRGDFKAADPARGRFRDLLKRALRHLVIDHWRHKRVEKVRMPIPLSELRRGRPSEADWRDSPPPRRHADDVVDTAEAEETFLRGWRSEMLAQAWRALARFQEQQGGSSHTILRLRADRPEAGSAELAGLASARLGKPLSEAAFRQLLRRAREKFVELLVAEVARTLPTSDPDAVEEELSELDLLCYCRRSLSRTRNSKVPEHTGGRRAGRV